MLVDRGGGDDVEVHLRQRRGNIDGDLSHFDAPNIGRRGELLEGPEDRVPTGNAEALEVRVGNSRAVVAPRVHAVDGNVVAASPRSEQNGRGESGQLGIERPGRLSDDGVSARKLIFARAGKADDNLVAHARIGNRGHRSVVVAEGRVADQTRLLDLAGRHTQLVPANVGVTGGRIGN